MKTKFNVFTANTKTVTLILSKSTSGINKHTNVKIIYVSNKNEFTDSTFNTKEIQQNEFVKNQWNTYFLDTKFNPTINMVEMSSVGCVKFGKKTGYKDFFVLSYYRIKEYNLSKKYLCPVISSDIRPGLLNENTVSEYLLNVNETKDKLANNVDGRNILKYIELGEKTTVTVKRGSDRASKKLPDLPTMKSRTLWYSLQLGKPPAVLLSRLINNKVKIYENNGRFHAINTFVYFTPKIQSHTHAYLAYFASSFFSLYLEQNGHPMGGGALSVETIDYKQALVPDFCSISENIIQKMKKAWIKYRVTSDQNELDKTVLKIMGFDAAEQKSILTELRFMINRRTKRTISNI